jgi:hypothetical protein
MYGPDGTVYFEAGLGDLIAAAVAGFGGGALAATGSPNEVGIWIMLAGILFALIALGRIRQALKAGKAFRGGKPIIRFRKPRQ